MNEKVSFATKILNVALDNVHKIDDVLRRSKRQIKKNTFRYYFYTYNIIIDPISYFEAISSFDVNFWKKAIQTKLELLIKNQTWKLVYLSPRTKPISCICIFKIKFYLDSWFD